MLALNEQNMGKQVVPYSDSAQAFAFYADSENTRY